MQEHSRIFPKSPNYEQTTVFASTLEKGAYGMDLTAEIYEQALSIHQTFFEGAILIESQESDGTI